MLPELSAEARHDLSALIAFGVGRFGEEATRKYVARLRQVCETIVAFPRLARRRVELGDDVRAFTIEAHVIVYEVVGDDVVILRIRQGREDWLNDTL